MELEQPATESIETPAAPETTDSTQAPATGAAPVDETTELLSLLPEDDGMEEIEHEGIKAKVPKELKDAFLRQQDYTRKTQEVAEQRRQIEAAHAEQAKAAQFLQQNIHEVAGIVALDNQLAEYQKLDWNTLIAQNPQQAQLLDRQMRELQGQRAQLAQGLEHKRQQQALMEQQATARRIQESQQELAREIKGWSPEVANKLTDYGRKAGFPPEVLSAHAPPALVKVLHKAMQWDQLIAQRSAKPKSEPAKPITTVGAKSAPAAKADDDMTADEWRRKREAELAKKSKRR